MISVSRIANQFFYKSPRVLVESSLHIVILINKRYPSSGLLFMPAMIIIMTPSLSLHSADPFNVLNDKINLQTINKIRTKKKF